MRLLMCNNRVEFLEGLRFDYNQADFTAMDSNRISRTNSAGNDENPRAKFLCSFGGSVLPRPLDGKLRYVGGETRIVSVPRNIRYEELMGKMRELYEVASILKYQQPDEDLDALVSLVNDDDVTNMMEEFDKLLGSGDGFTRLRIFLFSHLEQDASPRYMEGGERDTEKRYVDALNSLNESPAYRRQQFSDSHVVTPFDEIHIADPVFNSMNLDGSVHNQRNYEMGMPPYNLGQLTCPSIGSGQPASLVTQLHNEEPPWSPAYSPRYAGAHETRTFAELASPSAASFRMDRMTEETAHQQLSRQLSRQLSFDRRQQYFDQGVWLPTGPMPVDMGGFPGNMRNGPNVTDCPSVCQHCRTTLQRSPSTSDLHRKPEEQVHVEQSTMRNGFTKVATPCVECIPQGPLFGVGRTGDQCTLDGPSTKVPIGPGNLPAGNLVPATYSVHEGPHLIRAISGGEIFHSQGMPYGSHVHVPLEERGVHTANLSYMQGPEILNQVSHANTSALAKQTTEVPNPRGVVEGSARSFIGVDQIPFESPQRRLGGDGSIVPEYAYGHLSKLNPHSPFPEVPQIFAQDPLGSVPSMLRIPPAIEAHRSSELPSVMLNGNCPSSNARGCGHLQRQDTCNTEAWSDERSIHCGASDSTRSRGAESLEIDDVHPPEQNRKSDKSSAKASLNVVKSNSVNPGQASEDSIRKRETKASSSAKSRELTSLPERIASAEGAKLEGAEEMKAGTRENGDAVILNNAPREVENAVTDGTKSPDVKSNSGGGSESECTEASKIEPTKAEEEAIAKGLQTIKNADLEEVRELGTGTYGAVYHGKWKGSDVAIKRIKASSFDGRPSERERLIADFWKEALILSSLHHPNVVSFYGVVRDGPDGSLATVTEFLVNGSLKQFFRKKDRTIDRRKRLIIAMDAAFGMEYLHEKNIVHFDLKCENLLVNMRDPHRPVCKIGDLGLSKVKQQTLVSGGVRGTLPWMAPELLSGKSHMVTEKIDVYSFGIVMWELLTGEEPYSDMHCASLIGGIVNNTLRPEIPTWCDPGWKALMESCWSCDSAERPSFLEISQKLRTMAAAMNLK